MPWEILFSWGVIVRLFKAWSVLARCTSHKQVVTQAVKHIHVKRIHAKRIQYEVHAVQSSVHSCAFCIHVQKSYMSGKVNFPYYLFASWGSVFFFRSVRFSLGKALAPPTTGWQPGSGVFCSFMCLCQSIWFDMLDWIDIMCLNLVPTHCVVLSVCLRLSHFL